MAKPIARSYILITPKFDGLAKNINTALKGAESSVQAGSTGGKKFAAKFTQGVTSGISSKQVAIHGAISGVFQSATNKVLSSLSNSLGSAISRFDTLKNYPKTMQQLGYSAKEAQSSIRLMSERLQGLPTSLDQMVTTVKGLAVVTGDIDKATRAGLALNDMLLASGSNTQIANAAMEQFRQILSKGKPDMQDWKSLMVAMPGQIDMLAKSMLGADATATDLYNALGGGGHEAKVSTDQLLDAMIALDEQGSNALASFGDQAKQAQTGIGTALTNIHTSVTRGLADLLDAIGGENISSALASFKGAIDGTFKAVSSIIKENKGLFSAMAGAIGTIVQPATILATVIGGAVYAGVGKAQSAFQSISGTVQTATSAFKSFVPVPELAALNLDRQALASVNSAKSLAHVLVQSKEARTQMRSMGLSFADMAQKVEKANSGFGRAVTGFKRFGAALGSLGINPIALGLGVLTTAIGFVVNGIQEAAKKAAQFEKATTGMKSAADRAANLSSFSSTLNNVGKVAGTSALSVTQLTESISTHVDKMNEITSAAETQLTQLNTAQAIINEYAGKTGLTTEAQGKLTWALELVNKELGENITLSDAAKNEYKNAQGEVVNLKESINELIETKKSEAKTAAITESLTEAYKAQAEAAKTYAQAQKEYTERYEAGLKNARQMGLAQEDAARSAEAYASKTKEALDQAREAYDSTSTSIKSLETNLGDVETAARTTNDAFQEFANDNSALLQAALSNSGQSMSAFTDALRVLGADTNVLASLSTSKLLDLVNSWDGSTASMRDNLSRLGVAMHATSEQVYQALRGMGAAFESELKKSGVSLSDLAKALESAGVSAEDLNRIGARNLKSLASECNGNINSMISSIKNYNATPLIDKTGKVSINDAKLKDAQNNVYTWNGTRLVDKYGNAAVNDISLTDAQGNVWRWNGTALVSKDGTVRITQDGVSSAINARNDWNGSGWRNYVARATITTEHYIKTGRITAAYAEGGIRPHADGGIRKHADGSIVNKPVTGVPLDIVGEAGAEAIVPLTNKRYSYPFADTLVERMNQKMKSGNTYNITVDGHTLQQNDSIKQAFEYFINTLTRHYGMGAV